MIDKFKPNIPIKIVGYDSTAKTPEGTNNVSLIQQLKPAPAKPAKTTICLGTCKTAEGCTCGRKDAPATINGVKACGCGKNPGGACGGALKKAEADAAAAAVSSPATVVTPALTGGSCCSTGGGGCSSGGCSSGGGCCSSGTTKLEVYDWLHDLPESQMETQMVEVQFKNTRKAYYINSNNLDIYKGDTVAVESTPGHDIGVVTLTGKLVLLQMKKNRIQAGDYKRVYRIAKATDLEKYDEAKAREHKTMIRARQVAEDLGLQMKISDVEYQGDGNKAIFYYIADDRVDFRQLIKVYAEEFHVKIEMKQIGARQEAGRVGGIGSCGRELCCSKSISSFVSVSTSAARYQDISLNPQKLAGQCGKLKCCLNYEVDTYVEAQRQLPSREIVLETKDASFFHFKTDILSGIMTYSSDKRFAANLASIDKERVYDIIRMNKSGKRPSKLELDVAKSEEETVSTYKDVLDQDSITRFDRGAGKNTNGNNGNGKNNNANKRKKKIVKASGAEALSEVNNVDANIASANPSNGKQLNRHQRPNRNNADNANKEETPSSAS